MLVTVLSYCTMDNIVPKSTTPPIATPEIYVDSIIFQLIENELAVLLTKREEDPFKDMWALPGGINAKGETTYDAMQFVLEAKTGIKVSQLGFIEQLYTFDTVTRDPHGHAVSVTYMGLGRALTPRATPIKRHTQFFTFKDVPQLGFDHNKIIEYAQQRLVAKLSYTNAVFALLPSLFTLSQLQIAYEAVLGRELDKRNFRKKYLGFDLVKETSEYHMEGAHRPARLYKFNKSNLEYLSRSFD